MEASAQLSFTVEPHTTNVVAWEIPSAIVVGERFRIKVGIKCSIDCDLTQRDFGIYDHEGAQAATGTLPGDRWPGTSGLYFAEVELLATAQGIAGRALGDSVKFRTRRQGVDVTAPGGLSLSGTNVSGPRAPTARAKQAKRRGAGQSWLFEIDKLHQANGDTFAAMKHRFLEAAYKATPAEQSRARLRLAQLHFANSRYADVIGILSVVESDEPKFVNDPVFRALRGASYFTLGAQKFARRDLFHNSLDPYNEISLWRGAVDTVDGKWVEALRYFSRSEDIVRWLHDRGRQVH